MVPELLPPSQSPHIPSPAKVFSRLSVKDREIDKLKYENPNLSLEKIGRLLTPALTKQAVSKRIKEHGLREVLEMVQGDIVQLYLVNQARAVEIMRQTMEGEQKSYLQYQAARDFLKGILDSPLAEPPPSPVKELIFEDANVPKALPK